jgi:hypothetical protein
MLLLAKKRPDVSFSGTVVRTQDPLKYPGFRNSGTLFNTLFSIYSLGIQHFFGTSLIDPIEKNQAVPALGVTIFLISILEGICVIVKIRSIYASTDRRLTPNEVALWFGGPLIFRLLTGLVLSLAIGRLISPDLTNGSVNSTVAAILMIVLIIKELITVFAILLTILRARGKRSSQVNIWYSDLILLAYCCIIFTLFTYPGLFFQSGPSHHYLLPLIFVCFFLGLLSLRTAFFLQEYLLAHSIIEKSASWVSLVVAAAIATGAFV